MSDRDAGAPPAATARPFAGRSAGLSTDDDWRSVFASFPVIALVANSAEVDVDALRASLPSDALFVFFNQVFKVLDRPFDGNSLLAVRSGGHGVKIVRHGEVDEVASYFPSDSFLGIMCLRASSLEIVTPASAFGEVPTGHLDLADYFADFYPSNLLPSTGFALAVWLSELGLGNKIILAGFSARRSEHLKLAHIPRLDVRAGCPAAACSLWPADDFKRGNAAFLCRSHGALSGHSGSGCLFGRSRSAVGTARKRERGDRQADLDDESQSFGRELLS